MTKKEAKLDMRVYSCDKGLDGTIAYIYDSDDDYCDVEFENGWYDTVKFSSLEPFNE